jgi:hypothetical protein
MGKKLRVNMGYKEQEMYCCLRCSSASINGFGKLYCNAMRWDKKTMRKVSSTAICDLFYPAFKEATWHTE